MGWSIQSDSAVTWVFIRLHDLLTPFGMRAKMILVFRVCLSRQQRTAHGVLSSVLSLCHSF